MNNNKQQIIIKISNFYYTLVITYIFNFIYVLYMVRQIFKGPLNLNTPNTLQDYLNECPSCLKVLDLHNIEITSLQGVKFPPGLTEMSLYRNKINSLHNVVFPKGLLKLDVSSNQLTSLQKVKFPRGLIKLE
jgi:Leucine-rich repeat (LRR) protein